jgi:hypothetical protein
MKRVSTISHSLPVCVALVLGSPGVLAGMSPHRLAAVQPAEVVARFHYVGHQQVNADTNGSVCKAVWQLPESTQLLDKALDNLAAFAGAYFQPKAKDAAPGCAALLRPLLADLRSAEFCGEVLARPQGGFESTLALHLDEARSRLWAETWAKVLANWEVRPSTGQLSYIATNSWFGLRCVSGPADSSGNGGFESPIWRRLGQGQRPVAPGHDYWVKLEADLEHWANWLPFPKTRNLPHFELAVTGRKEYLRSEGRLTFKEPAVSRVQKWEIPTETIRDPLISFTALQGIAGWLHKQPFVQELGLSPVPNQVYFWGLSQTAFQVQAAVPVADAPTVFDRIAEKWIPKWNQVLAEYADGNVQRLTNRAELIWRGLPILVPYLQPARDHGEAFLHGGVFPVQPPTNAPPVALFQQLTGQTNLVYYDWEITQARLEQIRPLLQVTAAFLTISPISTNSTAFRWLDSIEPKLGNSVTEVTAVSPRELNLVRTSHLGLNGLELLTAANWLESTNFPRVNWQIGFRPVAQAASAPRKH